MGSIPEKVTAQSIFDQVATHLIKQGRKATAPHWRRGLERTICVYRTSDGCECAFGCLIPDDRYTPSMENVKADTLIDVRFAEYKNYQLLCISLQQVHDNYEPFAWKTRLRVLAKIHGLELPTVLVDAT